MASSAAASVRKLAPSGQKITIDPEDVKEADDLVGALYMWSTKNGPILYQQWQSLFFGLKREFKLEDMEMPEKEVNNEATASEDRECCCYTCLKS